MRWYVKIPVKLILARLPISHRLWNWLGLFKHGKMQDFLYAQRVFTSHLTMAGLLDKEGNKDKVVMELGPGESLFTAILAKAYSFKKVLLVDVDVFVLPDLDTYKKFSLWIDDANENLRGLSIQNCENLESMLTTLDSQYLTNGLNSLKKIPDDYVDIIFSQAVLEHIYKHEFIETVKELWRVLKPGGVSTHDVDFRDHLESSLNNLRFSDQIWETSWIRSSGFYTNRILLGEMVRIFDEQGFDVEILNKMEWVKIPIPKKKLHPQFRVLCDDDLKISVATLRLRKPI